ncbi:MULTISPECIES: SpoIIE family protein phosphatase [Streptomyces]|uniref:SpoIIE family protein phosphatase n=1 Tax=Streptomyces griseosporeus TaxID=1910 RepID=A0ABV3KLK7_STRGS|nr:SpoIIE family protein phosphatase [Streptomyces actuosus]
MTYTATATIDERGVLTGWSEGARQLLGHEASAVVGRPAAELLAGSPEGVARALAGRRRWHGSVVLRHRDGRRMELRLLAHRRTPEQGAADWLVVTAVPEGPPDDGREPVAEWAFTQSPYSLAVFGTDLRLLRANRRMERALSLPEAAMRGLALPDIAPGAAGEEIGRQLRLAVASGEPTETAARLSPELGRPTVLTPLKDGSGRVRAVCLTAPRRAQDSAVRPWNQDTAARVLSRPGGTGTRGDGTDDPGRAAQELAEDTVPGLADYVAVDLLDSPRPAGHTDPGPGGMLVLRRAAVRALPGDGGRAPGAAAGEMTAYEPGSPPAECLATGSPVLYDTTDPAVAAWAESDPGAAWLRAYGTRSLMVVPLLAEGNRLGVALFGRHRRQEPFGPQELRLAEDLTARAAGALHKARGSSWSRTTTMALQRSLLPHTLPDQAALEIATRYLPAATRAGVGGDWFDVIPLSAARVALVVGDVVGHGIRASATMGRLRTAVRTLADVDLPADELLTHLDDLVLRLAADEGSGDPAAETAGGIGTTCLYAVYDPVSRRCSMARAGHPPPAVVTPDGSVRFLDVPAGPPLGLGGLPFEVFETELPEGSLLALYTDGLLEARDHDIDVALDKLFAALGRPATSLDSVCDRVLAELLSHRPDDDIALLVARTRALHEDRVASWELESDPAIVSRARRAAAEQLTSWGLDDAAFVTEMVVSELVTNAIRYGRPPVRLRLIHQDDTLVSEVYDSSGTTPHMRRARIFDEGGRGLLLVAQLADRWGTRHDRVGKTVWAEQSLSGPGALGALGLGLGL